MRKVLSHFSFEVKLIFSTFVANFSTIFAKVAVFIMISYSPKKPLSHLKRHYLTLSQAVVLAAGAASFAAVTTALLASHMFYLNPHSFGEEPNFEGPVGTIYSRTVIASNQMSPEDWNRWGHNSGGFLRAGCDLENLPEEQSQEASVPLPPSTNHDRDTGSSSPKVVWLMSFPNR